jgi:hypothetical protein
MLAQAQHVRQRRDVVVPGRRQMREFAARGSLWRTGGQPPGDLYRGATGPNTEETAILWFRAADGDDDGRYLGWPGSRTQDHRGWHPAAARIRGHQAMDVTL